MLLQLLRDPYCINLYYRADFVLIDEKMKSELKQQLILSLQQEESNYAKKKIADCIAELARRLVGELHYNILHS